MTLIKRFISGIVLFFVAIMLFSCNLEDFNLKKLANPDDIIPDVFAQLAYGTFKVKDLVTTPVPDNFPITSLGLPLDPVIVSKAGTSFRTSAVDSVYLITHFTNTTPVDIEFTLSFVDKSSGSQLGKSYTSVKILPGAVDQKIQFNLGPIEQDNLQKATDIKMSYKISSPDGANPKMYGLVKNTLFTIKISFYAPVNLRKL